MLSRATASVSRLRPSNIYQNRYHSSQATDFNQATKARLVVFGPPGAGKGTQCTKLATDYGLPTLSTGNLLRQAVAQGTTIGNRVKTILEQGHLVDDSTVLGLVTESLNSNFQGKGWVLDGYPRNLNQASQLDAVLSRLEMPLNLVLCLDVPDDEIIDRICNRWVHVASGRVYHTTYSPPKKFGFDDVTGEPLVQRSDDTVERVTERLHVYREYTAPLLDYYGAKGMLHTVTSRSSDEGYPLIKSILDQRLLKLNALKAHHSAAKTAQPL